MGGLSLRVESGSAAARGQLGITGVRGTPGQFPKRRWPDVTCRSPTTEARASFRLHKVSPGAHVGDRVVKPLKSASRTFRSQPWPGCTRPRPAHARSARPAGARSRGVRARRRWIAACRRRSASATQAGRSPFRKGVFSDSSTRTAVRSRYRWVRPAQVAAPVHPTVVGPWD